MVANCTASIAGTAEAVKSLRESTDVLENQVTAITDYIRESTVKSDVDLCSTCMNSHNGEADYNSCICEECSEFWNCHYYKSEAQNDSL